jgi:hypothetical protein
LRGGTAVFTDLSIDMKGKAYTLVISWLGNADIPDAETGTFDVMPAVDSMQLLAYPVGTQIAGRPFQVQPQVLPLSND